MGFAGTTSTQTVASNPFIEWIGNDGILPTPVSAGNFQFITASNPGAVGAPAVRKIVMTLRANQTTLFGETSSLSTTASRIPGPIIVKSPKVEINVSGRDGLLVNSINSDIAATFKCNGTSSNSQIASNTGLFSTANGINSNSGIISLASGGTANFGLSATAESTLNNSYNCAINASATAPVGLKSWNYGLYSNVVGSTALLSINCGVYSSVSGLTPPPTPSGAVPPTGSYAGYFNGFLYAAQNWLPSDKNLKQNIKSEASFMEKLAILNPVTYNYVPNKDGLNLNLPTEIQHGFVAQELEKVFPELVKDLLHPTFNEKNEQVGTKTLKAVNYNGLISILTASMKEMSAKIVKLEEKLATNEKVVVVKNNSNLSNNEIDLINEKGYFLGQNTPNPFKTSTIIEYSLPIEEKNASILIFNLNGQTIKEFKLENQKGSISINEGELIKGLYLYSLISEGQEIATKKMLVN